MPKRREASSCALKVPSAISTADAAKADATSADTSTTGTLSVTMEPTALETAAIKSTTTAVPSRPCYGTERHGCDANYQINYLSCFHAFTFSRDLPGTYCAFARFCDVTEVILTAPSSE
jgi:hypothetical protein